jgi:hypothetical protein
MSGGKGKLVGDWAADDSHKFFQTLVALYTLNFRSA